MNTNFKQSSAYELADRIKTLEDIVDTDTKTISGLYLKIAELDKELKRTKFAWNLAENEIERLTPQTKPLSDEKKYTFEFDTGTWGAKEIAQERADNPYLDPEANASDFKKIAELLENQESRIIKEMNETYTNLKQSLQTKPLSDEEIMKLWYESLTWALSAESLGSNVTHGVYFARAIEAKVRGEK